MKRRIVVICVVLLVAASLARWATAQSTEEPRLRLSAESMDWRVGQEVRVDVLVENAPIIYGADVQVIFDPVMLEVVDADEGTAGVQPGHGDFLDPDVSYILQYQANNATGVIDYALTLVNPAPPVQGDGLLAQITFRAKAEGQTTISIAEGLFGNQVGETIAPALEGLQVSITAAPCYTLTITSNPLNGGTVSADLTPNCNNGTQYTSGTNVTLTPHPNAGYGFTYWSGNASGSAKPMQVTMNSDKDIIAHFVVLPSIPTLVAPANNALVTAYRPLLDWGDSTPTLSLGYYQLQVADNAAFTTPVIDTSNLTVSNYTPTSDLVSNKTFYWRVRAFTAGGNTKGWSAARTFRTAVLPPDLNLPADNADLLYNRPTFEWSDVSGATSYYLQIAYNKTFTSLVSSVTVTPSTYTRTTDLPPNKTLYWRVRANAANGPSAWSEVRSLHTANPPSVPVLLTPLANALTTDYTPRLDWAASTVPAVTTFDHYELWLDDNAAFTSPYQADIAGVANHEYTIPDPDALNPNTTYYWRVRSYNTDGEYSAWSLVRTFRTALPAPDSLSADGVSQNLRPRLAWNMPAHPLPAPTGYTVQVSKNSTFTQVVHTGTATTMSYIPTADLPRNLTLYWHVRANGANGPSVWSAFGTYTTGKPPAVPALLSPASNALVTTYTPTLDWSQPNLLGSNFKAYRVEVATDANFASIARTAVVDVLANHFWIVDPPLDPNTKYYWHVQACNTSDECSAWSAARTFRTKLASPLLISPTDGSGTSNRKPTFTWGAVTGATSYTIQVSTNSSFTTLKVNNILTATSYTPTTDLPLGTLYWRVRANGANGPSGGAAYYTLTIPWTSTGGPWLNRGNVKILAIDQATEGTAYAVVETAGLRSLYRTTDGAQNWTLVHTFYEPFRSLAVNGTVLYLGGMDISAGKPAIWRSTDGGASWTVVYTATDVTQVYSITLAPGSTNHAYAALSSGSNGIILKTVNGVNWAPSLTRAGTFQEVAIDPSDPSLVFAGGNDATNLAKVYRSTNSGGSWSLVLSSDTEGYNGFLTIHPENPQIVFIKTRLAGCCPPPSANLWRSTNGGTDWIIIANRPFWGPVFARPDSIYVITDTEYTLNASATTPDWQDAGAVLPEGMTSYAVEDRMAGNPLLYIGFPIEGVYTSTDHLASVQEANNGFHNLLVPRSIKLDPRNEQTLYVATDQDGFKSTDGGATWTAMNLTVQPLDFAVRPDNSDEVLMGVRDTPGGQSIFRSTNGGETWAPVYTHSVSGTEEIAYAVAFDPTDSNRAFAVSGSWSPGNPIQNAVLTSTNGGQSWTTAMTIDGNNPGLAVLQVDPDGIVYLAGRAWGPHRATLYRSDDHGATWVIKYQGEWTHIVGLTFDPHHPDDVYMITGCSGCGVTSTLLKSTDRGETWQTILTSGKRLYSIVHDPTISGKLYLGMDGPAVWMSSNGGATWNVLGDWAGMIVATQVISLATNSDPAERILYAGLNGVWKYTNP